MLAALAALVPACDRLDRTGLSPDLERGLSRGRAFAGAVVAEGRGAGPIGGQAVVALGYLERLRLGLGSPFRLMDYARRDPRLDDSTRVRLVWALLARTLDGEAYQVDPAALDRAVPAASRRPGVGGPHLELIEGSIRAARDPRSGELAVRLAYVLSAAEGGVSRRGPMAAARVAALVRDRELARQDALRLLRGAEDSSADPVALIASWRVERRFAVERPPIEPLSPEAEREAMEQATRLAAAIRTLDPGASVAGAGGGRRAGRQRPMPLLAPRAAVRLAALADTLNAPPQTPVVVAVDVHRRELAGQAGPSAAAERARRRFIERARDEERFAAEFALLSARDTADGSTLARLAVTVAVGLRAYAQEEPWFPGSGGPSNRELEDRFGLASVRFDDDVPSAWRPYFRRMLAQALADMQRVLPALDLRGLRVRFGESRTRGGTLALHDPARRTAYFPPATGAGTIAHEIAHDVDWQVALHRYHVRGDYGTDRATRNQRDRLAASLRGLTSATLLPPAPGDRSPPMHARRPAEVFARNVDWFVVVSLARAGRSNGYLSSVQDDILTGYGTVTPPDVTGGVGAALVAILDEVAPVYPATREEFLRSYGPGRALTPYDLVRSVLEASVGAGDETDADAVERDAAEDSLQLAATTEARQRFATVRLARDAAFAAIDGWICRAPGAAYNRELESVRRGLVAVAAGARARGIALAAASELAGEPGRLRVARKLYGPPWPATPVDSTTAALLDALVEEAARVGEPQAPAGSRRFHLAAAPDHCAGGWLSMR